MKRSLALSLLLVAVFVPIFAFAETLEDFKRGATVEAVGMCDGGRTSLVSFVGTGYVYIMRVSPMPSKYYYVVRKNNGAQFFLETFAESGKSPDVKEVSIEEFDNTIASESPDFHKVLQNLPNGCGLQKVK